MTAPGCSVISPRMWPETAISARAARCASSSANFAGSPGPRVSARSSTKSAARISRWPASSASIRSTAAALPGCWRRCSGTASRSPPSISASSAPSISKQRFLAAGGAARYLQVSMPQGHRATASHTSSSSVSGCIRPGSKAAACPASSSPAPTGAPPSPTRSAGLAPTGEGLESALAKVRANANQPVICALHLASARIQFADRGKSSIILDDNAEQPDD